ncbi:MAG: PilZ domain-containing protein [Acidobacteria bacterium]|nr:PilZ domain-containing protein [Acidobacteriota bacterium]
MELLKYTAVPSPAQMDRRRTPRLTPTGEVHAEVFGTSARITITDVSHHGMKVQATAPFWPGTRHVIRVSAGHAAPIDLLATVVHCQRAVTDCGAPCFVVGWQFVPGTPGTDEAAMRLVDLVTGDGPSGLAS